ncbi:M28 family metallopeptidase [Algicella marina]|uniref:M28 family peptidase n=1 Tax=Algicella marina TaxID=2683284 RepID=A0A6P1SU77_9RHOB|nr:M28 family peptidase [Algicella marina]QHQ34234.1 M28 family peptidase [Algicella marina]
MAKEKIHAALVVLDQASGALREGGEGTMGMDLWPETRAALALARETGVKTALVVPTPEGAKARGALLPYSDGSEVIAVPMHDVQVAAEMRGGEGVALVSGDRRMRGDAAKAGMLPVAHAALLPVVCAGESVVAACLTGGRDALWRFAVKTGAVPLYFQPSGGSRAWVLIALMGESALDGGKGLSVERLECDPGVCDLVWQRLDEGKPPERRKVLYREPGQVLLALGPGETAEDIGMHGEHGHTEALLPDPGLLRPPVMEDAGFRSGDYMRFPAEIIDVTEAVLPDSVIRQLSLPACASVTAGYENDIDRYSGVTPLDAAGVIVSRHINHADNKRVEAQLLSDLRAMGYCPWRHNFFHGGTMHSNIIADLPGRGYFVLKPQVLERVREIMLRGPVLKPVQAWEGEMERLKLADWFRDGNFGEMEPRELRLRMEEIFQLRPWYPWWHRFCLFAGFGAGIQIVGCHLDSTAANDGGYNSAVDPAPGRDDNCSGLAGVLSMARYLKAHHAGKLRHTVRFCFFNAEEQGLVGSKAYAAHLKAANAPLRGALCLDMIGHNSDAHRLWEVHAGAFDGAARDASLPMAAVVESAGAAYGTLAPAQVYRGTSWSGAPDRDVYDGAINRSDHAAFHQQGWPAVLLSEDFFANLASEPGADPNPNYHRQADTVIDLPFARDIVCAATKAVLTLAG